MIDGKHLRLRLGNGWGLSCMGLAAARLAFGIGLLLGAEPFHRVSVGGHEVGYQLSTCLLQWLEYLNAGRIHCLYSTCRLRGPKSSSNEVCKLARSSGQMIPYHSTRFACSETMLCVR
jgi:hypothetical protein